MKVAIIGGGFSGLVAGYLLEKNGVDVTLYEKNEELGGHCRTLVCKDLPFDIGTICSFSGKIKELLIELQVDYTERFIYRSFVDENYNPVEHMLREDVILLMEELAELKILLKKYEPYIHRINYGYVPEDLMVPIKTFLEDNGFKFICQVICPYLSSFGFGSMDEIEAYYVFKVFNLEMLYGFIGGKKALLIKGGTSQLIRKLSEKLSHIKYGLEVTNMKEEANKVKVETNFDVNYYDKVLVATALPAGVIKHQVLNEFMENLSLNTFLSCAFQVETHDLGSTYYKSHLGKSGKVQFVYASKHNNKTTLVAYAYGNLEPNLIEDITNDIKKLGVNSLNLIGVKSWNIFPHFTFDKLTSQTYEKIKPKETKSNISLIGSLMCEPSLDNLYSSIKESVKAILP